MKRILLTTTALSMTAGMAVAEVSISGDFRLGFNDTQSNHAASGTTLDVPASYTTNATTGAVTAIAAVAGSDDFVAATTSDNKLGVYNDAGITLSLIHI